MAVEDQTWCAARDAASAFLRRYCDPWTTRERDDLAQESVTIAWQWARGRGEPRRVQAAVRTIARRLRSRGLKLRGRQPCMVAEASDRLDHCVGTEAEPSRVHRVAGRRVCVTWLRERLMRGLARLRPLDRTLLLANNEGFCVAELACRYERTPAAVKARLHRARRRLQLEIEAAVRAADALDLS